MPRHAPWFQSRGDQNLVTVVALVEGTADRALNCMEGTADRALKSRIRR